MKDRSGNILLLFAILEIASATFFMQHHWRVLASVCYIIGGLGVALTPVISGKKAISNHSAFQKPVYYYTFLGIIAYCVGFYIVEAGNAILTTKIKINYADMLPVIDALSDRFIKGEPIYDPIQEIWYGFKPKYLPMMWLPFVPAKWSGIDIRWTTVVFLLTGTLVGLVWFKKRVLDARSVFTGLLLFLILWYIARFDSNFVKITQEGVIVCFYLLLGYSLLSKNYYLQGITIAICLMSRYSFTFWVPMYFVYLFLFESRKAAFKAGASLAGTILLLLFVSGAYKELDTFASLQGNYLKKITDPANKKMFKPVMYDNLGIAKFFGYQDLKYLHYATLLLSPVVPFAFMIVAWFKRNTWNMVFFGIGSLKLTLVFFFNMLPLPYLYLFYTSTFLTLIILHRYINRGIVSDHRF